jgi:hypothetical protein
MKFVWNCIKGKNNQIAAVTDTQTNNCYDYKKNVHYFEILSLT